MGTKPTIIDTWEYTEGYVACVMGNEPHSVLDEMAVTVHISPGGLLWAPTPARAPFA